MKKLIFIFSIMLVALFVNAQTTPTEVTPDAYITSAYYKWVKLDTLTDSANDAFVWRVKDTKVMNVRAKLYTDRISGTAGGTLIASVSIDGVNYANADTITISGVASDLMDAEEIVLNNFCYPYLKLTMTQTGTTVCQPKIWIYTKYN